MHLNAFESVRPRGLDTGAIPLRPNGVGRPVDQLTMDGHFVKTWMSGTAAAREMSNGQKSRIRPIASSISNCVRGVWPSAYGFKWRYAGGKS